MTGKFVAPKLGEASFSCPHCGTLAHQFWYDVRATPYEGDQHPYIPDRQMIEGFREIPDPSLRDSMVKWAERMRLGKPFLENNSKHSSGPTVNNLFLSKCYSCKEITVWRSDKIAFPDYTLDFTPNDDMPEEIAFDFCEANMILNASPRGAAALLRLCIQKLLIHLGESGEKINDDIASLVRKGLDQRVQKSLDLVRVVGNNAVHPGEINWQDNADVARKLFVLVNYIVEDRISRPKEIDSLYEDHLTPNQINGINQRDRPKQVKDASGEKQLARIEHRETKEV